VHAAASVTPPIATPRQLGLVHSLVTGEAQGGGGMPHVGDLCIGRHLCYHGTLGFARQMSVSLCISHCLVSLSLILCRWRK
jgi:hypothetical protein